MPICRVTFAIISYNQGPFIREAVLSALAQDFTPLEIVISDDASTDSTYEVISEIVKNYHGPHTVVLNQNKVNLGIAGNINRVWELSSGELLVIQAGDDISKPHRTTALVKKWKEMNCLPDLICSTAEYIDTNGVLTGEIMNISRELPTVRDVALGRKKFAIQGCVNAYARRIHDFAGPLNRMIVYEDVAYSFRALLGGGVAIVDEPLLAYRIHPGTVMSDIMAERRNIAYGLGGKRLRAGLGVFYDFKQALVAHDRHKGILRLKLSRTIAANEMMMRFVNKNRVGKAFEMARALFTGRMRAFAMMVKSFPSKRDTARL